MIFNNTCLEILPASYGDCIFLSIKRDDKEYNILIDGGLASTYYNVKDKRKPKGPLKLLLDGLQAEGRCIDLLVVTHIDDDHIGGICKWFEMAFPDNKLVKQVWLNDDMQVDEKTSLDNSVSKAVSVLKKLKEKEVGYKNDIVKGFVQTNDFCTDFTEFVIAMIILLDIEDKQEDFIISVFDKFHFVFSQKQFDFYDVREELDLDLLCGMSKGAKLVVGGIAEPKTFNACVMDNRIPNISEAGVFQTMDIARHQRQLLSKLTIINSKIFRKCVYHILDEAELDVTLAHYRDVLMAKIKKSGK